MLTFSKALALGKGIQGSLQKQKFRLSFLSVVWMSCSCLISCEWQVTSRDLTRPQPKSAASADILSMCSEDGGEICLQEPRSDGFQVLHLLWLEGRWSTSPMVSQLAEDKGSCCSWCQPYWSRMDSSFSLVSRGDRLQDGWDLCVCVCACVWGVSVCVYVCGCICVSLCVRGCRCSRDSRRGIRILWGWSYRWLWAVQCRHKQTQLRSSGQQEAVFVAKSPLQLSNDF